MTRAGCLVSLLSFVSLGCATGAGPARNDGAQPVPEAEVRPDILAPGDTAPGPGPKVDRTVPKLFELTFKPNEADPEATEKLGTQLAALDTRATPVGKLVIFLHGAGAPSNCGPRDHARLLAGWGFHVLAPCYEADYGVGVCGSDIGGCRLEAFEGVDHSQVINVTRSNSIEGRVVKALALMATRNPQGDWGYFLEGGKPRWSAIVITGSSHGGSSSGVIGVVRNVDRVVMLSGPRDSGQAWLKRAPMTPVDRFYGFTHTADEQHTAHLQAFVDLNVPGTPVSVDGAMAPYGGSHRLMTSAQSTSGHSSTAAGGASPMSGGRYLFEPVWRYLYGVR